MRSILLALALLTSTAAAHAETPPDLEPGAEFYSTYFSFSVRGPKAFVKTLDADESARVAIVLPPEFVGWRCYRTPQSSMQRLNFENIACWHGEFTTGISLACRSDQESHDTKSFFLRAPGANGPVEVQISGGCMTTLERVRYDDGF